MCPGALRRATCLAAVRRPNAYHSSVLHSRCRLSGRNVLQQKRELDSLPTEAALGRQLKAGAAVRRAPRPGRAIQQLGVPKCSSHRLALRWHGSDGMAPSQHLANESEASLRHCRLAGEDKSWHGMKACIHQRCARLSRMRTTAVASVPPLRLRDCHGRRGSDGCAAARMPAV